MKNHNQIEQFLESVKAHLNKTLLLRIFLFSVSIGSVSVILTALTFIVNGYRCPFWVYIAAGCMIALSGVLVWLLRKNNIRQAGRFADTFFDLKDALSSYLGFSDSEAHTGFHDLQARQVAETVNGHSSRVREIPFGINRRFVAVTGGLLLLAASLGFVDDSDRVKNQREQEAQILAATIENNKELLKETEDIIKELEEEQADNNVLDEAKEIKKMVEELKHTKDQKEAMRQYAQLEKKLNLMLNSVMLKKDQQLLDKMATELKSEQASRELGSKLAKKEYQKAAEELQKMKQSPDEKDLQQKKELAKLNIIAQKMQAALSPSQRKNSSNSTSGTANPGANCSDSESTGSLSAAMENLSMVELVNKLNDAVAGCKKSTCQGNCNKLNACLSSMSNKMCKIGTKQCLSKKFASLCKKLGQCQSKCSGSKMCQSAAAGGKKAGAGSTDSRTDKTTDFADNGNTVTIQGLKGDGPSEKMTEESDSGSGTASESRMAVQKEYQRQAENFIQREDIPEEVRQGVKNYFENIHGI